MVRPRRSEAEHRSRTIGVQVTTTEAAEVAKRAADTRLTRGACIRRGALGQPVHTAAVHRLGTKERVGELAASSTSMLSSKE